MKAIAVSIIIPIYNVENYVKKTIDSAIHQSLTNIEIILIDDGSKDKSPKIVDEYAKKDKRIKVIHKPNEGVTSARKKGIELATGDYLFFLDGDDYLTFDALEKMYNAAEKNNADYVVGDFIIKYPDESEQKKYFHNFKELDNIGFLRYCFEEGDFYYTGRLIKKTLIDNTKLEMPTSITFGEDNIAVVQIAYNLKKAIKVNSPILFYIQRADSVTNKLKKEDLIERAKAINFIIDYAKRQNFYNKIQKEIELFCLREIEASIKRGYVDTNFAKIFLKLPFNRDSYLKDNLSKSQKMLLFCAKINMQLTMKTISFLKKSNL